MTDKTKTLEDLENEQLTCQDDIGSFTWNHLDSGKKYLIKEVAHMQTAHKPYDGELCVVYRSLNPAQINVTFVRPLSEFKQKFQKCR